MKSDFIASMVFAIVGVVFAILTIFVELTQRQLVGVIVLEIVCGLFVVVYFISLGCKFLDRIDAIHGIQAELKKIASVDNTHNKTIELLNKIDRHICTGFNVVSQKV